MTPKSSGDALGLGLLTLGLAIFTACVQHDPFFWDTVQLASKHAHFFHENQLRWAPLPPDMDSGHPPLLGYYLACVWALFGKTLPVSHWAMFPFLLANALLLLRAGRRLAGPGWAWWLLPLVLLDPVLLGQSALVSPDLLLLTFFLLALEGIGLPDAPPRPAVLALGIAGLCAVSLRGMMCAAALGVACAWLSRRSALRWRLWGAFLPGIALAAAFLAWHHAATGWTGFHPGSPWAPAFEAVGVAGALRNAAVLAWRWLDFGRFAEWLALGWLLARALRGRRWPVSPPLAVLFAVALAALSFSALRYANLSAHRYLLPLFLLFHFLVFQAIVLSGHLRAPQKRAVLAVLCLCLAGGNFWVYPHGVSMDWDSTLAHQPYHPLRADALRHLRAAGIPLEQVGSAFPNLNSGEMLALDGERARFAEKDLARNRHVFISNIFNDFSAAERDTLRRQWRLRWRQQRAGVWGEIYEKR
jgi:hypothetical protein